MGETKPELSFGRDNAVIIAVASMNGGNKLAGILASLILDLGVQALNAKGIEHVCVIIASGGAARKATDLAARKLPMIERPEIRESYVFDIDADSVDQENPPRLLIIAGRNSFPNRDAALQLIARVIVAIDNDDIDIAQIPILLVESEPSRRGPDLDAEDLHRDEGHPFRCLMLPPRREMARAGARLLDFESDDSGNAA